jgi:hypothetical protein
MRERPFLIRNCRTGAEYEIATLEKFERVYGDDPEWSIVTGPNRKRPRVFKNVEQELDDNEDVMSSENVTEITLSEITQDMTDFED